MEGRTEGTKTGSREGSDGMTKKKKEEVNSKMKIVKE